MAWQLMKGNNVLQGPGPLPENWGPICGLAGFKNKLGNLAWLGKQFKGMKWVEVPDPVETPAPIDVKEHAKTLLAASDWSMLPDVPMTVGEKQQWIEYRRGLRDIIANPDAASIRWPTKPGYKIEVNTAEASL